MIFKVQRPQLSNSNDNSLNVASNLVVKDDASTPELEEQEVSQLIGFLLLFISIVLSALTLPIAFIIGTIYSLLKLKIGEYYLQLAMTIDQLGNVTIQHIANFLCITKDGYRFGDRDETISSVLGKNERNGTLSDLGKFIVRVLDFIDKKHSLRSIDYFVNKESTINSDLELQELKTDLKFKFPNVDFETISIINPNI